MSEAKPAVRTMRLERRFGDKVAVRGIDLMVPEGSFFGFLGPNGAGKSTTIKCLTGLLRPSAGEMKILGYDPIVQPVEVKRLIGVVPEDLALLDTLTGPENLSFVGRMHGLPKQEVRRRVGQLLEMMDLVEAGRTLAGEYSHGMRKKLALAMALLPGPRLIFLDEPFEGIDAVASRQIKDLLRSFVDRGGTVFLTSHILEVVERLCDRIAVIDDGRIVVDGTLEELRGNGDDLEKIFLGLVGGGDPDAPALDWLG